MNNLIMAASEVDFSVLTSGMSVVTSALSGVWDALTSNPFTLALLASSVAGIGFGFLRKAKRAAR